MPTPLDEPAHLRDTVAERLLTTALARALIAKGVISRDDVVEELESIISKLPSEAVLDHGMTEALNLILGNVKSW